MAPDLGPGADDKRGYSTINYWQRIAIRPLLLIRVRTRSGAGTVGNVACSGGHTGISISWTFVQFVGQRTMRARKNGTVRSAVSTIEPTVNHNEPIKPSRSST
jgi:hypothetical protein